MLLGDFFFCCGIPFPGVAQIQRWLKSREYLHNLKGRQGYAKTSWRSVFLFFLFFGRYDCVIINE